MLCSGFREAVSHRKATRKQEQDRSFTACSTHRGVGPGLLREVDEQGLDEVVHEGREPRAGVRGARCSPLPHRAILGTPAATVPGLRSKTEAHMYTHLLAG